MFTAVIPCFETVVLQNKMNNQKSSLFYSSSNNKTPMVSITTIFHDFALSSSQIGPCHFTIGSLEDFIVISWLPLDEIIV